MLMWADVGVVVAYGSSWIFGVAALTMGVPAVPVLVMLAIAHLVPKVAAKLDDGY